MRFVRIYRCVKHNDTDSGCHRSPFSSVPYRKNGTHSILRFILLFKYINLFIDVCSIYKMNILCVPRFWERERYTRSSFLGMGTELAFPFLGMGTHIMFAVVSNEKHETKFTFFTSMNSRFVSRFESLIHA